MPGASSASQAGVSAPCADVFQPFQLLMSVAQYLVHQPVQSSQQVHVGSLLLLARRMSARRPCVMALGMAQVSCLAYIDSGDAGDFTSAAAK